MMFLLTYIINLLIATFVTTILLTDINSDKNNDENIQFMFFASFFSLTLISLCNLFDNDISFIYGSTIIVIFFIINTISKNFLKQEILKIYLISMCSILFGLGSFGTTIVGFICALISYIILYNSTDFYSLFFDANNSEPIDSTDNDRTI